MRTWLKLVAWVGGILGAVVLLLYVFVFDVWTIPGDDPMESASIEPNLSAGDVVLVSRHTTVTRGNLLRCPDPQAPGRFVVARAIASGGEHVEIGHQAVAGQFAAQCRYERNRGAAGRAEGLVGQRSGCDR